MPHEHYLTDKDIRFTIDPTTRRIIDNNPVKKTLVQFDHNSECLTFGLPRYIEGHDMSLCNPVKVYFSNTDKANKTHNDGSYAVDDLHISSDNTEFVVFSWTVKKYSTQKVGPLSFSISFTCVEDDNVVYEFNTREYTKFSVRAGAGDREEINIIEEQIKEAVSKIEPAEDIAAYVLVDESGNEYPAVLLDEGVELTATENDIRQGKIAVTDKGITTGEKVIPSYHTSEGYRIIPVGDTVTIPNLNSLVDSYDYTRLQAMICNFNTDIEKSVLTEKVVIDNNVYNVLSTEVFSEVLKNHDDKTVELGITNNSNTIWILRFFMYKEIY